MCCSLVLTSRTLVWSLLTLATTLAMVAALITPTWIVGPARRLRGRDEIFTPSLGLYNGCIKVHEIEQLFTEHCAPFVTSFSMPADEFPNFWKAALVLFGAGLSLLAAATLASLACCYLGAARTRKTVFTVAGTLQSIAGIMFTLALVLYPAGWGSKRIQMVCSSRVAPFYVGDCNLGWTYFLAIIGTVVTFICSALSIQAEASSSSTKVQEKLLEGRNVICLI